MLWSELGIGRRAVAITGARVCLAPPAERLIECGDCLMLVEHA